MSKLTRPKPVIYDPDPTDMQMRALENVSLDNLRPDDLSNPQVVQILIHNQKVNLTQLKIAEANNNRLQSENEAFQKEREKLRIKLAVLESKTNTIWLEIPVSIMSGFAINLLTTNITDGMGWFLLIISLVVLIYIRAEDLFRLADRVRGNTKGNDND